jgi:hypothetical protein
MVPDLINLGELSKPVTVLLEKISDAIGTLYEPTRLKRMAKAEVEANKIKQIGAFELESELEERTLKRLIHEESVKQLNIESIIDKALPEIKESANPKRIEDDWINQFFSKCKNSSNEDVQIIWSKILAGEANLPGSYSLQTLSILEQMQKQQAIAFTNLTRCTLFIPNMNFPFVEDYEDNYYIDRNITFTSLLNLQRLGLIYFDSLSGYTIKGDFLSIGVYTNTSRLLYNISFTENKKNAIKIGSVIYTDSGKELLKVIDYKSDPDIGEHFKKYLIKNKFKVE